MNIIIVGCGKVGYALARQLTEESHNITVIDNKAEHLEAAQALDVQTLLGNGTSFKTQEEAGVSEADIFIAVTDQDEVNLLSCLVAGRASGCKTVARVRSPQYYEEIDYIKQCMGTSLIINPEYATALEIDHLIRIPSAMEVDTFAKGRVELLKMKVPEGSVLDGMSVPQFSVAFNREILICIIERGDDCIIPNGQTVISAGDMMYVIMPPKSAKKFCEAIRLSFKPIRNVMILGGGTISYYLARKLIANGVNVKIIEKKQERCEMLSEMLPKASIVYGDATDHDMLLEEGIGGMDAFVSLTSIDEENVFLALYANQKAPKAKKITKNSRIDLRDIALDLPVGSMVSPKEITAEYISRFVRSQQNAYSAEIEAVYRLAESRVEALEFHLKEDSAVTGQTLMDLPIKNGVLICCIVRDGKVITPSGRDRMEKGDIVIVVTTHKNVNDITYILEDSYRKKVGK